MKTRKHRILCMLLTCSLLFSVTAFAAGGEPEQTPAEAIQVQTEAEVQAFLAEMQEISALESEATQQSTYLQSALLVDTALSDVYGGRYLDENKNLVILTTDPSAATAQAFQQAANNPNVEVRSVAYSWDELVAMYDDLNAQIKAYCDLYEPFAQDDPVRHLTCVYVDEERNCVVVEMEDLSEDVVAEFCERFDISNAVVFEEGVRSSFLATVRPGMGLKIMTSSNTSVNASVGFRAIRNPLGGTVEYGFTTAGHATLWSDYNSVVYNLNGDWVGSYRVRSVNNEGYTDIAFIKTSATSSTSNQVFGVPSTVTLSTSLNPAGNISQNSSIFFSGMNSYRTLEVKAVQSKTYALGNNTSVKINDLIYAVTGPATGLQEGDSGGVAWNSNNVIVGTLACGNENGDSFFAQTKYSCDALSLSLH